MRDSKGQRLFNREELRERFTYNPLTGDLRNKKDKYRAPAGELAGTVAKGRVVVIVHGTKVRAAEVVWTIERGDIPDGMRVSYRDWTITGYRSLKIDNLYLCTQEQYMRDVKHGFTVNARKKTPHHINPEADEQPQLRKPVFVLGRPPR